MTSSIGGEPGAQSRDPWNANAAFWDERMGEGNDWHLKLVRPATERLLEARSGHRVLDVGCGNGLFARHLATQGIEVVAIDAAEAMIERARSRSGAHEERIEYRVVDGTDEGALLALGEAAFDAAVANMVLMDMAAVEPLFRALGRMLRPGAPFVFSVMHPAFNGAGATLMAETVERDGRLATEHSVRVRRYLVETVEPGEAIAGQPALQLYFHRPLSALLRPAFQAGLVLDALEEPAFPAERRDPTRGPSWGNMPEIPPVLVARLRRGG